MRDHHDPDGGITFRLVRLWLTQALQSGKVCYDRSLSDKQHVGIEQLAASRTQMACLDVHHDARSLAPRIEEFLEATCAFCLAVQG